MRPGGDPFLLIASTGLSGRCEKVGGQIIYALQCACRDEALSSYGSEHSCHDTDNTINTRCKLITVVRPVSERAPLCLFLDSIYPGFNRGLHGFPHVCDVFSVRSASIADSAMGLHNGNFLYTSKECGVCQPISEC